MCTCHSSFLFHTLDFHPHTPFPPTTIATSLSVDLNQVLKRDKGIYAPSHSTHLEMEKIFNHPFLRYFSTPKYFFLMLFRFFFSLCRQKSYHLPSIHAIIKSYYSGDGKVMSSICRKMNFHLKDEFQIVVVEINSREVKNIGKKQKL
jgi:hypothetical protein